MSEIRIRKERENETRETEYVTRRAFWNLHGPGYEEHLLVHLMREADCYEKELSRVAELDGKVVGVILYAKEKEAGYPGIVIYGEPDYYPRHGFQTCDKFGITTPQGENFTAKLIAADDYSK